MEFCYWFPYEDSGGAGSRYCPNVRYLGDIPLGVTHLTRNSRLHPSLHSMSLYRMKNISGPV